MPSGGSKNSKPKASEVASEAKKYYIPLIRKHHADRWKTYSYLYVQPLLQLKFDSRPVDLTPPSFYVYVGDPADMALSWAQRAGFRIPLICAANDKRPGGDWETGVVGYEERLCRRSTLAATLATPGPGAVTTDNYPIPSCGGIFSETVVIFRGPHDRYEKLPPESWQSLPVCSVPATRWPKLTQNGTKYSFQNEREMVKDKLRGALRICACNNYSTVVIGDFGLGNGYRNPPQELAELWREVFLYDPELRGRIRCAAFVFEDPHQNTRQFILDDITKKSMGASGSKGKSRASSSSSASHASSSSSTPRHSTSPTDYQVFQRVFATDEIQRVLTSPDPRYGLGSILG